MRTRVVVAALACSGLALAQAPPPPPSAPSIPRAERVLPPLPPVETSHGLRGHFGIARAAQLLASDEESRLRGLERLAAIGSPAAVSMMVRAAREPAGAQRVDSRALLVIVRGLAEKTAIGEVRQLLRDDILGQLGARPGALGVETDPEGEDRDARLALARSAAALALASSHEARSIDTLLGVVADAGPGQTAAAAAIRAFPPDRVATAVTGPLSPALLALAGELGDLRAVDAVRAALHSTDGPTRAAALAADVALGDARAVVAAGGMVGEPDLLLREAGAAALVHLQAPGRFRAVEALLADDATAREGARLAALAADIGVVRALAARAVATPDPELRALAIAALGRCREDAALEALEVLAKDPSRRGDAAEAVARSQAPRAKEVIERLLRDPATRTLGARAYVVRAATRGEEDPSGDAILEVLAASDDAASRAVGLGGLIVLGRRPPLAALADPDPRVRCVVAVAALAHPSEASLGSLLRTSMAEPDPLARSVERAALAYGDPGHLVSGAQLEASLTAGAVDAPLAAMTLAAREGAARDPRVEALLGSSDPILRAHAARGLGETPDPAATGRLVRAYAFEVDVLVRRAIVLAIARRARDASPSRMELLKMAARLDADAAVRAMAGRAIEGLPPLERAPARTELAWIRLAPSTDRAQPGGAWGGALLGSDGIAVPMAFDPEGYALVPIVPGEARLLLAPRVPAYD